jgi:hypothetical protein
VRWPRRLKNDVEDAAVEVATLQVVSGETHNGLDEMDGGSD